MAVRSRLFPAVWPLLMRIRSLSRRVLGERGAVLMERLLIRPLLPPTPQDFAAASPGGGVVRLLYRERIGLSTLLNGPFEEAEVRKLCKLVSPGDCAIDVGANVGIFTIPLALAVGHSGLVVAVEPLGENVERLKANVTLNGLQNVAIEMGAAGATNGTTRLAAAADPAYASTAPRIPQDANSTEVRQRRLDDLWREHGHSDVAVIKIDVEGAELDVLQGAAGVIERCRPFVLLEAASADALSPLTELLEKRGYIRTQPEGFRPWNHLFEPAERRSPIPAGS